MAAVELLYRVQHLADCVASSASNNIAAVQGNHFAHPIAIILDKRSDVRNPAKFALFRCVLYRAISIWEASGNEPENHARQDQP